MVLIRGEFYVFTAFFLFTSGLGKRERKFTYPFSCPAFSFPHTHWPGLCWSGRGHALPIAGEGDVVKHRTLTLSDLDYYSFISRALESSNYVLEFPLGN